MASRIPGNGGKVQLNRKGIAELMKSAGVQAELENHMRNVQSAIPGSDLDSKVGRNRVHVRVSHGNNFQEAATGQLSRALDLAGGKRAVKRSGR